MWTTKIVFSLSLSPPSLSTKVIVRACSPVRSAELFNVISFSILSVDFFLVRGEKRENLYLYIREGKGKIGTESNQIR
jgi:hypothetical protein